MRRYIAPILVLLLLLPVITIFIFDARYSAVQNKLCAHPTSQEMTYACTYPERTERDRIVTTAFYRHVGDYFGRPIDTSPSWMDEAMNTRDGYIIRDELANFNQKFALAMIVSIAASASAGTILVQKFLRWRKAR